MSDQAIEREIQAKGLKAPRITPADIEANVVSEYYFTAREGVQAAPHCNESAVLCGVEGALGQLTFCVLVLRNGFTVTGESACASPENFDPEVGRKIARKNAIEKVWPLMGYQLRERLAVAGSVKVCGDNDCGSAIATLVKRMADQAARLLPPRG
jgi:hypothetical protein